MRNGQSNYRDRIIADASAPNGEPVVKGTRVTVERVIEHIVEHGDIASVCEIYPDLTVDDVRACLAYAQAAIRDRIRLGNFPLAAPGSPQEFYGRMAQRDDVRVILSELAR